MKKKKILLIVIIIITVLAVAGTVFGYLYLVTDTFKSDKELFAKYMSQNTEVMQKLTDLQINTIYENLKNENKYNSNTKIKAIYSEGGEISNPINDLNATIDIQKDKENEYFYIEGQILHSEDKYFAAGLIKQNEYYGIRLPDVVKQFLTIKNDENLIAVANDLGIDSEQLNEIIAVIDQGETNEVVNKEKAQAYWQIIYDNFSNGTFSSLKDETNAYIVELNSEQVKSLLTQILNKLKDETFIEKEEIKTQIDELVKTVADENEIPSIKVTVYENDEKTIKTVVEVDTYTITLENKEENGKTTAIVQISNSDAEKNSKYIVEISKEVIENKEVFGIVMKSEEGKESYTVTILSELQLGEQDITINSSIKYEKDILAIGLELVNETTINEEFEKKQTLEATNNVILNNLQTERRISIINQIKEKTSQKMLEKMNLLAEALGIKEETEESEPVENQMSQLEVNQFNAKFEFFTGDKVSAENVNALLEVVKNNLVSYELVPIEIDSEEQNDVQQEIKYKIKLNIQKDQTNETAKNEVIAKIDASKKYNVTISYKQGNGLIDYIMIGEVED